MPQLAAVDAGEVLRRLGRSQQFVDEAALVQASIAAGGRVEQLAHALQERPAYMLERGHREITFRAVDHRVGDEAARHGLEREFAALAQLEFGRHAGRKFHQGAVEKGHAQLQCVGHGQVVHALDRVVDDEGGDIETQHLVEEGVGAGPAQRLLHQRGRHIRHLEFRRDHAQPLGMVAVEVMTGKALQGQAGFGLHVRVPEITAEHFVRPLAGKHDFDVAPDPFGQQVEGYDIVAEHRLGHARDGLRQSLQHRAVGDAELVVACAEGLGDEIGILEFIGLFGAVVQTLEADGVGAQVTHMVGQQAHQQAGIEPAREQYAHRDIGGVHMAVDRAAQHRVGALQPLGLARRLAWTLGLQAPVGQPPAASIAAQVQRVGRFKLAHALQDGARRRHHRMQGEQMVQGNRVDGGAHAATGQQRRQAGGEAQALAVFRHV